MSNRPVAFVFGRKPYEEQTIKFGEHDISMLDIRYILYKIIDKHKVPNSSKDELFSDCLSHVPYLATAFKKSELNGKKDNVMGYIKTALERKAILARSQNHVVPIAPKHQPCNIKRRIEFFDGYDSDNSMKKAVTCELLEETKRRIYIEQMRPYIKSCMNNVLTKREREVIEYYFGLNGKEKLEAKEIAKLFSITKQAIYLILGKSFNKMRKFLNCVEENKLTPEKYFLKKYKDNSLKDNVEFMLFIRQGMVLLNCKNVDLAGFTGASLRTVCGWRIGEHVPNQRKREHIKTIIISSVKEKQLQGETK